MFSDAYIRELAAFPRKEPIMDGHIAFTGRDLNEAEVNASDACVSAARELESEMLLRLKPSRETSLALTNLEQALMWVNKSIRNNGVIGA